MPGTYSRILLHFVTATKGRAPLIDPVWQPRLYEYIGGIVRDSRCTLLAAGGIVDHIHLLVKMTTDSCPADLMRLVKANSSRWINQELRPDRGFQWQESYATFSVSPKGEAGVTGYINNQKQHHLGIDSAAELRTMLAEAGLEYDPGYFE